MKFILIITEKPENPHRVENGDIAFLRMSITQWKANPSKFEGYEPDAVLFLDPPPPEMEELLRHKLVRRNGGMIHLYNERDVS